MMDIETLATAEIQGALAALPRVKSFIHDGDKEDRKSTRLNSSHVT